MKAKDVKERASIYQLLAALGHQPAYKAGKELYYHSPLNPADDHPSFALYEEGGQWHNFCEPVGGGKIIELGLLLWPALTFPELLQKIVAVSGAEMHGPVTTIKPAAVPTCQ